MNRASAILGAALLLAATATVAWFARERLTAPEPLPVLDTLGGEFSLPGTNGREVALADFRGRLVLLNFGFTSCPDVCPTVLARMHQLLRNLGPDAAEVQPLFVTIDPTRDTPERLGPYLAHFGPGFIGLYGSEQQVAQVAALFRVFYQRTPLPAPLDYGFMHSEHIYLIDRTGRVRATFGGAVRDADMAATVRRLLDEPAARGGESRS